MVEMKKAAQLGGWATSVVLEPFDNWGTAVNVVRGCLGGRMAEIWGSRHRNEAVACRRWSAKGQFCRCRKSARCLQEPSPSGRVEKLNGSSKLGSSRRDKSGSESSTGRRIYVALRAKPLSAARRRRDGLRVLYHPLTRHAGESSHGVFSPAMLTSWS